MQPVEYLNHFQVFGWVFLTGVMTPRFKQSKEFFQVETKPPRLHHRLPFLEGGLSFPESGSLPLITILRLLFLISLNSRDVFLRPGRTLFDVFPGFAG